VRQSRTLARPAASLAAGIQRISSVNKAIEIHTVFYVFLWIKPSMIAMATSLEGSKTNFGLVIYSYGSINPENFFGEDRSGRF